MKRYEFYRWVVNKAADGSPVFMLKDDKEAEKYKNDPHYEVFAVYREVISIEHAPNTLMEKDDRVF